MTEKAVKLFIEDFLKKQKVRENLTDQDDRSILFQGLSEESLQALLSNSHILDFSAHKTLVQQGDLPEYLYCIVRGSIKTLRYNSEGEESTIRMLSKGETFMDAVIFMGGSSPISAQTMEDSTILMIPAETVRRHAIHDSLFACNLLKIVTRHYKNAIQQIDSIVTKTPVERIGYYFLKLHLEQGSAALDVSLPFQKSTIANHLGMTPETFSRTLGQVRKLGIDVNQEKITLRDAYVLCHFCDSDTAGACPKFNTKECPLCTHDKSCH